MKTKFLSLAVVSALFFSSCGNSGKVSINGTSENSDLEGKYVYVVNKDSVIDSTKIENGKFSFELSADSVWFAYLQIPNVSITPFVIESGKLTAKIDSLSFTVIKGTKQNNELSEFFAVSHKLQQQWQEFMENAESKEAAAIAEFESKINEDYKKKSLDFVKKNANNLAGKYLFMESHYYFTAEEKDEIIALFNEKTKSDESIAKIIALNETAKKSAVGQDFIDFKQPYLLGDSLSLSDLVGKYDYVLIDFWASWCGPCIRSLPELKELYAKYGAKELEILGVSLDNNEENWKKAIKTHCRVENAVHHTNLWKHVSDLQGWQNAAAELYAVQSIPATVLINKQGKIVAKNAHAAEVEAIILEKK